MSLRFGQVGAGLGLRELTGFDERCVRDVTTATALDLLDRLVVGAPSASWRAAQLTAADRDRLLAAVYRLTYGQRVETTSRCAACAELFDLSFGLDELLAAVDRAPALLPADVLPDGTFRGPEGTRFRLPTGEDELAVAGLPPQEAAQALLERCVLEASPGADLRALLEETFDEVAPVLDLDIRTVCPECGSAQTVHFDMQFYLLRALAQERAQIAREIHRIARAYGWSLQEILGLTRSERRLFVGFIESEMSGQRRPQ